jgi:hypothetical protein
MSWGGIHPLVQVVLGAGLGYAVARYVKIRRSEDSSGEMGIVPNRRYEESTPRTSRRSASKRCVARVGGECKFPVGDQYHQRLALAYVMAGRCSNTSSPTCDEVVDWVARHGSGEAKQVARRERGSILRKSSRAKSRRGRTRARRSRKRYAR